MSWPTHSRIYQLVDQEDQRRDLQITSTGEVKPKNKWNDSNHALPADEEPVIGWNGRKIIDCRYDILKKMWINVDNRHVIILLWRRE